MIYVFLAEGFEEIEALATVDVLRRAGQCVATVGVTGKVVTGAHGIPVTADLSAEEWKAGEAKMVVLPGGMPGTKYLDESAVVRAAVQDCAERDGWIAAICAAPSVLGHLGLLKGKQATCYPGFEEELFGAEVSNDSVCRDGKVITANGPGAALQFAFTLTEILCGAETAEQLRSAMQCR